MAMGEVGFAADVVAVDSDSSAAERAGLGAAATELGSTSTELQGHARATGLEPATAQPTAIASVGAGPVLETSVAVPSTVKRPAASRPVSKRLTNRALRLPITVAAGLIILAAAAVPLVRWLVGLPSMQDFLATYPGETPLPDGAPQGIPGWLAWQHFFNTFFMVLIIRTGWQVRTDKRPGLFWTPRFSKGESGKISLSLWFHQSLDVVWLVNGVIFVVLLFATGQWTRVVPTSWEIFPNAISAGLQYVSLEWPTENGWVNYNSLQVLAYFVTIFIAAPLAAISGVRMSGFWPSRSTRLNRAYPIEWARAIHFPVMLYFVVFIIVHVALVLATGALRNLNHMYGGQDAVNWIGFWIFLGSLALIAAVWIAARPIVLAPIARLTGKVSRR